MNFRTRKVAAQDNVLREKDIQEAVIRRLRADDWLVVRMNGGGMYDKTGRFVCFYNIPGLKTIAGLPDVLAFKGDVRGGRFLMIEVKDAKGQLSEAQQRFHQWALNAFKIKVHIVRHPEQLDAIWEEEKP